MGGRSGPPVLVPGAILAGAGVYQVTSWKQYCLRRWQTPVGFLLGHWRSGRGGPRRIGAAYAAYGLGCCRPLMPVVVVTGSLGLPWVGAFAGLVLVEKIRDGTVGFPRGMGIGVLTAGAWISTLAPGLVGLG